MSIYIFRYTIYIIVYVICIICVYMANGHLMPTKNGSASGKL